MKTFIISLVCALASSAVAGEPFGWRGDGTGRFNDAQPPIAWSGEKNIVWKASLPNGFNSPVYCDGRIFVTAEPAQILCFDADSGKELWRGTADYAAALGSEKAAEIKQQHEQLAKEKQTLRAPFEALRKQNPKAEEPEELKQKAAELDRQYDALEKQFPLGQRGRHGERRGHTDYRW